jgi:hypothetical protein
MLQVDCCIELSPANICFSDVKCYLALFGIRKRVNWINATPIYAISKNATAISKLRKMPLQFFYTSIDATLAV